MIYSTISEFKYNEEQPKDDHSPRLLIIIIYRKCVKLVAEWQKHIPSPIEHMFQQQQRHHHHHPPITVVVRQCGILIKTKINDLRNESLIY